MTTTFSVSDTRFLHRTETEVMRGTLRSAHNSTDNLVHPSALAFRADLSEYSQKAAAESHRQLRLREWSLEMQADIKAKAQGTLVSVLQAEAQQHQAPRKAKQEDLTNDRRIQGRQQQVLALAFLVVEAHCAKKQRMAKKGQQVTETRPVKKGDTKKVKFDIGDEWAVNLLFSDVNFLLQQQDSAKVDVTQHVRSQLAELNMWE